MSLEERTLEWLKGRKPPTVKPWRTTADDNFCQHCKQYDIDCVPWYRNTGDCPTERGGDFRDAAEFEARVAASIAQDAYNCAQDEMLFQHQEGDKPQGWYILRDARLAVEEEMELEGK